MCNGPIRRLLLLMEFLDPLNPTNEELSRYLWEIIPKEQIDRVFSGYHTSANIHPDFMGFVQTYWHLSKILPKETVIYDFGCAYNAQSFFFTEFERYYAIEPECEGCIFQAPNCEVFEMTARQFVTTKNVEYNSFAIVNYVPMWHEDVIELIHENFQNCYTFYPIAR